MNRDKWEAIDDAFCERLYPVDSRAARATGVERECLLSLRKAAWLHASISPPDREDNQ
jgi:hypothetical protein